MNAIDLKKMEYSLNCAQCISYIIFDSSIDDKLSNKFIVVLSAFIFDKYSILHIKKFLEHLCKLNNLDERKKYIASCVHDDYSLSRSIYLFENF